MKQYKECGDCVFNNQSSICEFCEEAEYYEPDLGEAAEPLEFDDDFFSYDREMDPADEGPLVHDITKELGE